MLETNIVIVEDDKELANLIRDFLFLNEFQVEIFNTGYDAIKGILSCQPDLVILDVMLPDISGMDICRTIRPKYNGIILMFTALDDDMDHILGLELGADDYIIKPMQPRVLLTKIRTFLRPKNISTDSLNVQSDKIVNTGSLVINCANRTVMIENEKIELTSSDFELLLLLAGHIGEVVDRDTIIKKIRGFDYNGFDRSIDRRVCRLRKKIQKISDHDYIKTIHGKGYQLCVVDVE